MVFFRQQRRRKATSFSELLVADIMRRDLTILTRTDCIAAAIRGFIKQKIDAVLVVGDGGIPAGVITKTEMMGAYYAMLAVDTPLSDIMGAPVIRCSPSDSLESALITMQNHRIHRVYATDHDAGPACGSLSYTDVVGALYRYCCNCDFSLQNRQLSAEDARPRLLVSDVMTRSITTARDTDIIIEIIDQLGSYHLGALPIVDHHGHPAGVISKTDLTLAYHRGLELTETAERVMSKPVMCCDEKNLLEDAIRRMIFAEIGRLFVTDGENGRITGVLSLSDAARARSGSCEACSSSRIIPKR